MTYYITKYALTKGIGEYPDGFLKEKEGLLSNARENLFFHGEGRVWHRTLESAVAQAEEMRAAKIASLEKAIKKMKALEFNKVGL